MEFLSDVDIANRALQHCGSERMGPAGFAEVSKRAKETQFAYAKLRRAELARNVWTFATRRTAIRPIDTSTMQLAASLWVQTTTYFVGSIVGDAYGRMWQSAIPGNLGNFPWLSAAWESYFGPLTVSLYDAKTSYQAGELVYTTPGDGTGRVYVSLISANTDVPATATAWDAATTYDRNQVVTYLGTPYMSLINLNLNRQPNLSPAPWSAATTYGAAAQATGSDGVIYTSIAGGNTNHDPTFSPTFWSNAGVLCPWTATFVSGTGSLNWRQIGGVEFPMGVGLNQLNIIWPLDAGPASQSGTRNVYRLPAGFLRECSQDPKAGASSQLGAPTNLPYDDWEYEAGYLVTRDSGVIPFRFVADMADVTRMDDMFCEGLAARIAKEVAMPLTQSSAKHDQIDKAYEKAMRDARTVNAIEAGAEEPPLDDWIACRA